MSRPTDTFRGARMAWDIAHQRLIQPDLFGPAIPPAFWHQVREAARDQIDESIALEDALRGSVRA